MPALVWRARGGKWESALDDEPYGGRKEMRRELKVRLDGDWKAALVQMGCGGHEGETGKARVEGQRKLANVNQNRMLKFALVRLAYL